jgi:hypothetical protein
MTCVEEQLIMTVGAAVASTLPINVQTSFTPSFACTFDSNQAAGGMGYYDTLDGMHYKAKYAGWKRYLASASMGEASQGFAGVLPPRTAKKDDAASSGGEGAGGEAAVRPESSAGAADRSAVVPDAAVTDETDVTEPAEVEKQGRTLSEQLEENAVWINELLGWQEMRAFNGVKEVGQRENLVGKSHAVQRRMHACHINNS